MKSQLKGKNKIHTINIFVSWPKKDMEVANVKIWKLFTMYRYFQLKSNTQRLYINPKESRGGLVCIKTTVLDKI